jgi:hypothetical protein
VILLHFHGTDRSFRTGLASCAIMDKMPQPPIPFSECISMVAFLFLFAPVVVLIAVWIMQRFQPRRELDPAALQERVVRERVVDDDRIEPRFGAVNDNAEYAPDPGTWMDQHSISTG